MIRLINAGHDIRLDVRDPDGDFWLVGSVGRSAGEWYGMLIGRSRRNRDVVFLVDGRAKDEAAL